MSKKKNYKWVDKELKFINDLTKDATPLRKKPSKKILARTKRYVKQYEKQGWSDMDTWNMDVRFAEWIVPRLRRFIELHNGFPGGDMTEKQWDKTLKEMLEGFEFMTTDDWYGSDEVEKQEKAARALKLFGEWAPHLWW